MTVKVTSTEQFASCCICRMYTRSWHASDVACCALCASLADEKDIPLKKTWIRRERIATRRP